MANSPVSTTAQIPYVTAPEAGVRAYQHFPITGKGPKNIGSGAKSVVIENIRGKEDSFSLDTAGFQYYKHTSKHTTFDNDEEIRREYYPESIELIKKLTGASRVEIFDHTIRRRHPELEDSPDRRQPSVGAHVDQSTASAIALVHKHLPASDAPKLLERRFQIINLWRPIANPTIDWPLTLCDYRSVDPENDTFPIALFYPNRESEAIGIKYNENHKWKYLYGMAPEEIVLIKCCDSIQDGSVAIYTPHTSFSDPTTPEGTPLRQSIELRCLVFYD